jgi:hypothetical protein
MENINEANDKEKDRLKLLIEDIDLEDEFINSKDQNILDLYINKEKEIPQFQENNIVKLLTREDHNRIRKLV